MKYFDAHTHLNLPEMAGDWSAVAKRALAASVSLVNIGTDLDSSRLALEQAETLGDGVYASVGIHPAANPVPVDWLALEALASSPKVVAIGECGLDYFHINDLTLRQDQAVIFRQQVEIALKLNKPLMIHCRPSSAKSSGGAKPSYTKNSGETKPSLNHNDAYFDLLNILTDYHRQVGEKLKFNLHFFAGDWDLAEKFLAIGACLSFTGVLTFTHDYDEVVKNCPLDRLMAETDAPYVAPVPYRGQRNEPAYVIEVVKAIARIRGEAEATVAEALYTNAIRFFGLK